MELRLPPTGGPAFGVLRLPGDRPGANRLENVGGHVSEDARTPSKPRERAPRRVLVKEASPLGRDSSAREVADLAGSLAERGVDRLDRLLARLEGPHRGHHVDHGAAGVDAGALE